MQPYSKWDDLDYDLLSALDRLERDTSERTGLPWWKTRTGHPQVEIAVETVDDAAESALDKWDEDHAGKKKRKGQHRYAVVRGIGMEVEGGLAREAMLLYASEQNDEEADDELRSLGIETRMPEGGYDAAAYG